MAQKSVVFGDFSEAEIESLYSRNITDLEFVWQATSDSSGHSSQQASGVHSPQGNTDNITHFPSATLSLLDLPERMTSPTFGSGTTSPNIPPNPPTSPVEGPPKGQTKLNIYAPAFVPGNISIIGNKSTATSPSEGKVKTPLSSPTKEEAATIKNHNTTANIMGTNNRHMKSATSVSPDQDDGDRPPSATGSGSTSPIPLSSPNAKAGLESPTSTQSTNRTNTGKNSTELNVSSPPERADDAPHRTHAPLVLPSLESSTQQTQAHSTDNQAQHSSSAPVSPQAHKLPNLSPLPHGTTSTSTPSTPAVARTPPPYVPTSTAQNTRTSNTPTIQTAPPLGTPPPVSSGPKSWASIVGKSLPPSGGTPSTPVTGATAARKKGSTADASNSSAKEKEVCEPRVPQLDPSKYNSQLRSLAAELKEWSLSHETVSIQPRGLINQGNWCYTHAPLQALLSCPAIYNLLKSLSPYPALSREPSATPITDSMVQFVHEFDCYPKGAATPEPLPSSKPAQKGKKRSHKPELLHGEPFRPDYIYEMLHKIRSNLSYKGRQEDAEEFLGCILDGLHEEMVSAKKTLEGNASNNDGSSPGEVESEAVSSEEGKEEEWEQVGPKNKSTITRQTSFSESPITEIFGGEVRSAVHRHGAKESATVEPFFSLQLDIQSEEIWTVKDALDALAMKETVHMTTGTKTEVEAHKRITLARLPPVLILHLKRFIFDKTGGSQKLLKYVQYSVDLEISKELLAPAVKSKLSPSQRSYRLWAVVYHHGKFATGGHYTCDMYHPTCGGWIRIDDSMVKQISEDWVLKHGPNNNKVAYLLFYRRLDSVSS